MAHLVAGESRKFQRRHVSGDNDRTHVFLGELAEGEGAEQGGLATGAVADDDELPADLARAGRGISGRDADARLK